MTRTRTTTITIASLLTAGLAGAAFADDTNKAAGGKAMKPLTFQMKDARGRALGTVVMTPSATGIAFKLDLKNLPPGEHAIMLHETGICEGPDFRSTGDQVRAPSDSGPGEPVELTDITADAKGAVRTTLTLPDASLRQVLVADDGSALVIHAGSDAAADGADRIACGVISVATKKK